MNLRSHDLEDATTSVGGPSGWVPPLNLLHADCPSRAVSRLDEQSCLARRRGSRDLLSTAVIRRSLVLLSSRRIVSIAVARPAAARSLALRSLCALDDTALRNEPTLPSRYIPALRSRVRSWDERDPSAGCRRGSRSRPAAAREKNRTSHTSSHSRRRVRVPRTLAERPAHATRSAPSEREEPSLARRDQEALGPDLRRPGSVSPRTVKYTG
jgi:hypothetical protein